MNKESTFEKKLSIDDPRVQEIKNSWDQIILEISNKISSETSVDSAYDLEKTTLENLNLNKDKHGFLIISAPSGGGKGTIGKNIEKQGFEKLPRYTTRSPRPGEIDGKDYYFISKKKFKEMDDEFFPFVETHGEFRATSKKLLNKWTAENKKFYIEGSTEAYDDIIESPEVKNSNPLSIFLLPPSFEEHFKRLIQRPDNITSEEILERLNNATKHLKQTINSKYSGYIVNDNINRVTNLIIENY